MSDLLYRVVIVSADRHEMTLMYSGEDVDEAIEVYEECRADTLFGIKVCDVHLVRGVDHPLARTYADWFTKIDPFKAAKVAAAKNRP